jgi:hypothetical protein
VIRGSNAPPILGDDVRCGFRWLDAVSGTLRSARSAVSHCPRLMWRKGLISGEHTNLESLMLRNAHLQNTLWLPSHPRPLRRSVNFSRFFRLARAAFQTLNMFRKREAYASKLTRHEISRSPKRSVEIAHLHMVPNRQRLTPRLFSGTTSHPRRCSITALVATRRRMFH